MKKVSDIASVESKAGFQEVLLEKFVQENLPPGMRKKSRLSGLPGFADNYTEIEYCAAETPVTGTVEIFYAPDHNNGLKRISVPIVSRFIVFCARGSNHDYKVSWSCSLS